MTAQTPVGPRRPFQFSCIWGFPSPLGNLRSPRAGREHRFAFIRGRTLRTEFYRQTWKMRRGMGEGQCCKRTELSVGERRDRWSHGHTCWLKSILWTKSALSFLETTAWLGTMARWQCWGSVTGFLVPSRHSSRKSSCFRFLAQVSVFLPDKRGTETMQ